MKQFKWILPIVVTLIVLAGCATVSLSDVSELQKGMTPDEAHYYLPLSPKAEFDQPTQDDFQWFIEVYELSTGDYKSQYVLAYQDGRLYYWGYPHEFQRSNNKTVNKIGLLIQPTLEEIRATSPSGSPFGY